jgi:hypothetical protein
MKNSRIINLRLDEEMVKKLDTLSSKLLISRSELIRQSLTLYLSLLDNIGFYFKPSIARLPLDIYEDRNAIHIDLGSFNSISVFTISYGGVGELEQDEIKTDTDVVVKTLARQIEIESICNFTDIRAVLLSTANSLHYSMRIIRELRKVLKKRVLLSSYEGIARTRQTAINVTVVGVRDLSVRNSPKRGDKIYLFGRPLSGTDVIERFDEAVSIDKVRELAERVKAGELSSIFPVKSEGIGAVAAHAASLAGGKALMFLDDELDAGCPATAVIVTGDELEERLGEEMGQGLDEGLLIGEII